MKTKKIPEKYIKLREYYKDVNSDTFCNEELSIKKTIGWLKGNVYFLQCNTTGRIKIGFSKDIKRRIDSIIGSSPTNDFTLLGVLKNVGIGVEKHIHSLMKEYRHHFEWYNDVEIIKELAVFANNYGR